MDHVTPNTHFLNTISGYPGGSAVKESSCNAGDAQEIQIRFLGQEDSLEKEMATHSSMPACLENPMDRGAQWATVHRVSKNQAWLSN